MKRENLDKIISLITNTEKNNDEINRLIFDLNMPSRNELLKEVLSQIIQNNQYLNDIKSSDESTSEIEKTFIEPDTIETLLDNLLVNIQKNPIKKVIYLKLFFDRFHEISEQDKNVIIQSVKDEPPENVKEKLSSLLKVFKLEI